MTGLEELAGGLRFPEGPVAMPDGSIMVAEVAAGRITRIAPDGHVATVAETGGGPNGLALGPDGLLYCCNNGGFEWTEQLGMLMPHGAARDWSGGSIQRIDPATGRVETLHTHAGPVQLRGPNDLVFDAAGGFWFTDHGKTFARSRDVTGVFYVDAGGAIAEAIFPLENPNGIGLSPDGSRLYVAETYTAKLWAFDLEGPGRVRPGTGLAGHSGQFVYGAGGYAWFDSLAVDAAGHVCVATIGAAGISVIAPDGALVDFVATPDPFTTNLCFGGAERRTAFVTLSGTGKLVRLPWPRPGLQLAA